MTLYLPLIQGGNVERSKGNDWGGYEWDVQMTGDYFISQAGGAGTPKLIKKAREQGKLIGTYYWNSALKSAQVQIDEYSSLIEQDKPDFIILDFEHWWAEWAPYWDAIGGKRPWAEVPKLTASKIADNGFLVREGIKARWKGKYYLNYSADWFVKGYSPSATAWLNEDPFHVASYPDYGVQPYTLTLDQIKDGKFMSLKAGLQDVDDYQPTLPAGITHWEMWQYSSRIKVPGEAYAYDWNVFNGSLDDLKRKCGLIPPVTPALTIEERLARLEKLHNL